MQNNQDQTVKVEQKTILPNTYINVDRLPSQSITYPEGCEISYRTFTFGEIKRVSSSSNFPIENFNILLNGINTSFDKNLLTLADFIYIGLLRRISTLGTSKIKLPWKCRCKTRNTHVFTLNDLEFDDISVSREQLPLSVTLADEREYKYSPITVGGFISLLKKKKHEDKLALMALYCINLDFNSVYDYYENCNNIDDMEVVKEIDQLLNHSLKPLVVTCEECLEKTHIALEGQQQMLLPFREVANTNRNRICFGNAPKSTDN